MNNEALLSKAREYCTSEKNPDFRSQVEELIQSRNFKELQDRFYTELAFGTGGLRGIIGGGFNRMNPLVVGRATQGLANYVNKCVQGEKSAVIAFDSRHYSDLFALEAALVLCANGIKTYLFSSLRPTPELSFAVRQLKAVTGIVITASHNPPQYNGYKVYWDDGSQVIAPHDQGIIEEARAVGGNVQSMTEAAALKSSLLVRIDAEIDEPFIAMVKRHILRPELFDEHADELSLVYTPLHGTGLVPVRRILGDLGVKVTVVPEQQDPDGDFTTVKFPNPEEADAMQLAIRLGEREKADLVMGTDPDADRLGIAVKEDSGFRLITGNQLGVLLVDYVCAAKKELDLMPKNPAFIKTIVTTELQRLVAEGYGVRCYDTLTGFKYICAKIREFENMKNGPEYIFGNEESYGYLPHTEVRDKDAVSTAVLTAEMALYYRVQGKTLVQRLQEIYKRYGYFEEIQVSKYVHGQEGMNAIRSLMDRLRKTTPEYFAGKKVVVKKDYLEGTTLAVSNGRTSKDIDLPASNVIQFVLEDDTVISARPSGTEPKIKFYASCRSGRGMELPQAMQEVERKITRVREELHSLTEGVAG
ncbi:MAG: phospho-sugar mutase [Spirochaetia bacterium]